MSNVIKLFDLICIVAFLTLFVDSLLRIVIATDNLLQISVEFAPNLLLARQCACCYFLLPTDLRAASRALLRTFIDFVR